MSKEELDLTGRLTKAISSYEARWKTVDKELYDLCHRRPSLDDFADVYTKVAIIGRVYEAGVARAWRGKGDPESEITHVLVEQADLIQTGLQRLENRSFGQQAAADIVELHGHVARAISHRTAGVFLVAIQPEWRHAGSVAGFGAWVPVRHASACGWPDMPGSGAWCVRVVVYGGAVAGGSQGWPVNSRVRASSASMPHLPAVDR